MFLGKILKTHFSNGPTMYFHCCTREEGSKGWDQKLQLFLELH